jgi:CIC family chloride channel protein
MNGSGGWRHFEGRARFGCGVLLAALAAAAFAVAFRASLSFALERLAGTRDVVSTIRALPVGLRLLAPALGGLAAGGLGLLVVRSPAGRGVGDVMAAVVLGRLWLSLRVTLVKSLASWCAIVSGGSLGREGPLIQFGGAVGKFVSDQLRLSRSDTRLLIAAGTAAGFAAAYNTPFAAVLFVLEVVTGIVVLDAILPTLVATVVASAATRAIVGDLPIYGQRSFHLQSPAELLAFAGLGIAAALTAHGFVHCLALGERVFRRPALPLPWRPALGGLVAGAIAMFLPEVAGNGYEPLNTLLDGGIAPAMAAAWLIGKCFATTASVSSGSPGGVFTPTLLIGGCTGALYANVLSEAGLHLGPAEGYALVGMAAATGATTHAPLMAAVMVFELAGDYAIALPLVLATAVATMLSRALGGDSLYAAELRERGVAWTLTLEGRVVEQAVDEPRPAAADSVSDCGSRSSADQSPPSADSQPEPSITSVSTADSAWSSRL